MVTRQPPPQGLGDTGALTPREAQLEHKGGGPRDGRGSRNHTHPSPCLPHGNNLQGLSDSF